jgi:hypothetical protein
MGIYMAADETKDMDRSLKAMKKKMKEQKKAKKKDKKKGKLEKKIAKKEAKLRKKGVFLDDLTASEEEVEVIEAEEDFEGGPWVRKSTEDIPFLEKKIDMMGDRSAKSGLHDLFEERFGESLITPVTYQEYELTEREKRRLEALRAADQEEAVEVEATPVEVEESTKSTKKKKKKIKAAKEAEEEGEEPVLKPIYYPFQLWIYKKFGTDKNKVLKVIILLISVILFVLSLLPRFVIWIIITIFKFIMSKVRGRKAKKATSDA